uniref:Ketoreductase (KR) domain-containing protein n=1 Tax=Alexandrium catenella TaxID=2925 RepID=A0A7S1WEV7_ALECA
MVEIKTALLNLESDPKSENCAASGVCFFQVFASTSALLGLSRSSDYGAVNGNLNSLIHWRRTFGVNGQSNMWGAIAGTGLAGSGTGAAGRHGDTGAGHAGGESAAVAPRLETPTLDHPKEYYQRGPARADFVICHKESCIPVEMRHKPTLANIENEGFMAVRGLQVTLKTKEANDKVLLICNLPTSSTENHDGISWTYKRGSYMLGPQFVNWTHDMARLDNVLMPWLDEPGKARMELSYSVNCRMKGGVHVSREKENRQLTALVIPGTQVTSARSHEPLAVGTGRWFDVPGLQQISVTNPGEKVLVICTIKYTALWSDEMARGRFTIFRDEDTPLDPENYGLQSVRATQSGIKRTLVMALVDTPAAGAHTYKVKAAVTTGDGEPRVCHLDEDDRQLSLIRLPAGIVVGPSRCNGPAKVTEDRWTEIPGMSITADVKNAHDKVLLNYHTNFNPAELSYEAYFTVFRTGAVGSKNLGHDDQGMWSVASASVGSSEYPVSLFTDCPGAGTYTYAVYARTRRCDAMTEPTEIEVGPDGQIAAVLLETKPTTASVVEAMTKEMEQAGAA